MTRLIYQRELETESTMTRFAAQVAPHISVGDTLLLVGDIGAGKSAFARGFIRSKLGTMEDIPSPTFTLVQTYEVDGVEIWHCDLYRLSHADEALELGLDEAFETAICLIEWPDRLGDAAPHDALVLHFEAGEATHSVAITGSDHWAKRLSDLFV